MDVVVVGGHGQIAQRLLALLVRGGDRTRGVVRRTEQVDALAGIGAEGVLFDLERDEGLAAHLDGADAVVFAAGAGPGSGVERKRTVDLGGAVKLVAACREAGVARYVIVSSVGAQDPAAASEAMRPYLEAKAEADAAVRNSGLDWTIVRPGRLTDDPGTGRIDASLDLGRREDIPRDDVAATLRAVLEAPNTVGKTFELFSGEVAIEDAVRAL